jgi:hypothetical protein
MAAFTRLVLPLCAALVLVTSVAPAQWISFTDQTATRLSYSAATTDPEEKDFQLADMDNDGDLDLVNVRKEGFYGTGSRTHLLFMNVAGVLVDQTATYAPGFISNPSLARVVVVADFDLDGWNDVVVANTDFQPSHYYRNMGGSPSSWGGLSFQTGRIPTFTPGPRFCSAAAGDVDNDGDPDLFLGDYNNTLENRLLINNGSGFFTDQTATRFAGGVPSSGFSSEATFADFNTDGALDIMDTQAGSTGIHLNKNGGVVGQFTARIMVNGNANYTSAAGDLTNDGKADIYAGQDGQDSYLINTTPSGSMTLSFTQTFFQDSNPSGANYSPLTTNFAGNPYIVDMDNDGYKDFFQADTDVDAPGCFRRASLVRNVFPTTNNVTQVLTNPWSSIQNFNTVGTHDLAIFDLNGDGWNDAVAGLCTGYRVWIQNSSGPVGLQLQISSPQIGSIDLQVSQGTPSSAVYTLFSTQVLVPIGSGPFFGLAPDAFTNFTGFYPNPPVLGATNASGVYAFAAPAGTIPVGFTVQARSLQLGGTAGYTMSNVVNKTW